MRAEGAGWDSFADPPHREHPRAACQHTSATHPFDGAPAATIDVVAHRRTRIVCIVSFP